MNFFRGYETENELVADSMGSDKILTVLGGIVFYDLVGPQQLMPSHTRYAIRMNDVKVCM